MTPAYDVGVRTWLLSYPARPWLVNGERAGGTRGIGGHHGRSERVREWRQAYVDLCVANRVPPLRWVCIEALQTCRTRIMPDIGACYPAVKAAIDGLVDAGVIPNDRGDPFIRSIEFKPPVCTGADSLVLRLTGPPCTVAEKVERDRDVERAARLTLERRRKRQAKQAT